MSVILRMLMYGLALALLSSATIDAHADETTQRRAVAEARANLTTLGQRAVAYYQAKHTDAEGQPVTHRFPEGSFCTSTGNKQGRADTPNAKDYEPGSGFHALGLKIAEPHFNTYCYRGKATSFTLTATSSIDGPNDVLVVSKGSVDATGAPIVSDPVIKAGPPMAPKTDPAAYQAALAIAVRELNVVASILETGACEEIAANLMAFDFGPFNQAMKEVRLAGTQGSPPEARATLKRLQDTLSKAMTSCSSNPRFVLGLERLVGALK